MNFLRILFCTMLVSAAAFGQAAKGGGKNEVVNGDFQKYKPADNIWDGVNQSGAMAGFPRAAYAVTESGPAGGVNLPITVNWIDMNGDGLGDVVTCDPLGVMRVYFNSGSKTAPKFTYAETVPLFLSRPAKDDEWDEWWAHGSPKIALYADKGRSPDLFIGNYAGELLMVKNTGTPAGPNFPQPNVYAKATIPTAHKGELWANLLAPCVYDWNKDGKADLLVGEGSYSANAVHLLLNEGTTSAPKFSEESRYYLCYGDGREHLTPTVVDYNGDGLPDVLVGNRQGTVAIHLNAPNWKPGTELKFAGLVKFAGKENLGAAVAPCAADVNGDGLFDLIIGRSDGRVQIALNTGTPTEPKFDKIEDLKGENLWGQNINLPDGWSVNAGEYRGNLFAYIGVSDEKSPTGGNVLKMGYWPPPNKIMKMVPHTVAGRDTTDYFRNWVGLWHQMDATRGTEGKPTNAFCMRQFLTTLKNGTSYTLNFKAKGARVQQGQATVALLGFAELSAAKAERKARGVNMLRNEKKEELDFEQTFAGGGTWSNYSKQFTVNFKEKEIKALPGPKYATLEFKCYLTPFDGECEIADVEIVEKK